jgi:ribosomal protein S18 acetylase RimI-like enzyme
MEDPFKNQKPRQEMSDISIKFATPKYWRECKDLRMEGLTKDDGDAEMLGSNYEIVMEEQNKNERDWEKELSPNPDTFVLLAERGSAIVGTVFAVRKKGDWWHMGRDYVKKEFQGQGIGKKLTAERLREIIKRGGTKATAFIRSNNERNIPIYAFFGFKEVNVMSTEYPKKTKSDVVKTGFKCFELDLTDSKVKEKIIKRINEVLNAG